MYWNCLDEPIQYMTVPEPFLAEFGMHVVLPLKAERLHLCPNTWAPLTGLLGRPEQRGAPSQCDKKALDQGPGSPIKHQPSPSTMRIIQVWLLTHFFPLSLCKKLIYLEGKSMTPCQGNTVPSLSFLSATPLCPSQILEGFF